MSFPLCPRIKEFPRAKDKRAKYLSSRLREFYPNALCALDYAGSPYRLLVMARLSAQCTDKRVNLVAPALFKVYPDFESLAAADQKTLEELIFSTGTYRAKAVQLIAMARMILERFGGEIPKTQKELLELPGVGTKIANLMLGDVFDKPAIVADTHVIRFSNRMGFVVSEDQHKVEEALEKLIPRADRADFCHRAVLFCRETCSAQRPKCETCPMCHREEP